MAGMGFLEKAINYTGTDDEIKKEIQHYGTSYNRIMNASEPEFVSAPEAYRTYFNSNYLMKWNLKPQHVGDYRNSENPLSAEALAGFRDQRIVNGLSGLESQFDSLRNLQNELSNKLESILGMVQEAKQAQLQQDFLSTSGALDMGIAQESMSTSTKQVNNTQLDGQMNGFRSTIERLKNNGFDVSGLENKLPDYENKMKAKFDKMENQAKEDLTNNTALSAARLSGDKTKIATAEYDTTKTALDRAKEQKIKDTGSPELADQWYNAKLQEAEAQRQATIREGTLEEYDIRVQHNEMLKQLEGKTQAEIDKLNRDELQKKLIYLNEELKNAKLTSEERAKLEQEKVSTVQKGRDIDARDPSKATAEAKRRIKETTVDYAAIQVDAFNRINDNLQNHFTAMLTGAESFSKGFKGIFKDMTTEITNMMIKMWYNKMVLGPLQDWWGNLLDGMLGGKSVQGPLMANGSFYQKRAMGGSVRENNLYLVGEQGPELFVPSANGNIVPNHMMGSTLASGAGVTKAPPVTVNVINKTGTQANARQETKWDGQQYIVNVVLDAYSRNVGGMRDLMGARRSV